MEVIIYGKPYNIEIGKRFGSLIVLKEVEATHFAKNKYPFKRVLCLCDCGKQKEVDYCNLINGSTQSCGCQKQQKLSKFLKKTNQYDLSGEYGIGYTLNGEQFLFDIEDYDIIKQYCWHKNDRGYIATNIYPENNKNNKKAILFLHRLILNLKKGDGNIVDHKDRDKLNNRKSNLRITTQANNCNNKSLGKRNSTGVLGVGFSKEKKAYRASIGKNNKFIHLGYFPNKNDAIKARLYAEKEYFGEFAPQKYLFKEYGIVED